MRRDLHELSKLRDSISYIYIEHALIEQENQSIVMLRADGRVPIPVSSLTCLMLGPGTRVTHAAVKALCDNGCMAVWCGQDGGRFYASGMGETRSAANTLRQAKLCMDEQAHLEVVRRMYLIRFPKQLNAQRSIQQLRGLEGIRVKEAYKMASKQFGVPWKGRDYKQKDWDAADPVNRALSGANAILYSLCNACIVSLGYSPALGFIHTGRSLSFVYDIADLYKAQTTIPAAFQAVKERPGDPEQAVRGICRKYFQSIDLMKRVADDIAWVLSVDSEPPAEASDDPAAMLWDQSGGLEGGVNYGGRE